MKIEKTITAIVLGLIGSFAFFGLISFIDDVYVAYFTKHWNHRVVIQADAVTSLKATYIVDGTTNQYSYNQQP